MSSNSFFGNRTTKDDPAQYQGVMSTGGRIDEIVSALVGVAQDGDNDVTKGISKSLFEIGKKQPDLVLSTCNDYIKTNQGKISREHRIILLNVMYNILESKKQDVTPGLAVNLVQLAISEMTKDKEVIPDWQQAASSVLVSLATRFPHDILTDLLSRFQPGQIPHYFIMKSLGDVVGINAIDTVPRLKEIMARVLPVLSSIKMENIRWVFAAGIGQFCESIIHYVANRDKAADKSFDTYSFSSDMFPAYEILVNQWLISKEIKVRLTSLQAIGNICQVLSRDLLEQQLPKVVPIFLKSFKTEKPGDHLHITQGFHSFLWVSVKDGSRILDPHLLFILQAIHPLSCYIPEPAHGSAVVKNYNELLRCWQTIGISFSENIISYLLERLGPKEKDMKMKIGTLAIIRHLITHSENRLDDLRGLIVTGVKPLTVSEPNLKIRRELAHIVIAMASRAYMQQEGGEAMMEFIIRQSSIGDAEIERFNKEKSKDKDDSVTPGELRGMADNILNLVTTTIEGMESALWPYLFEAVVPGQYTEALGTLCKCISYLAKQKRDNEVANYMIDFDRAVNLPKPHAIIARLMVMLNVPQRRNQLGINILNCLRNIGPILHPSICDMWDNAIPKLITFLEDTAKWNTNLWEELVLRLLGETIKVANDDEWTVHLGEQYEKQLELYNVDTELKRVAFKHMGLIMQKTTHKQFINSKLDAVLGAVNANDEAERIGCAQAFGYCASTHLDMALEKVANAGKAPVKPSGGGLFSFLNKDKEKDKPDITNVLIMCYGYIAAYAQPNLITSRIEISIINNLKPIVTTVKSLVTKECIIKTVELIGKAMHPNHLKKEFIFKQRDDLLKLILNFIVPKEKTEVPANDAVRIAGLSAVTTLINLEPALTPELETAVLERIVTFYALATSPDTEKIIENLNGVLTALLMSNVTIDTLCRLLKITEPWVCSKENIQRERSCNSVLYLLKKFLEIKKKEQGERKEKLFSEAGHCIAMLIPRCTDPIPNVRVMATESIQIVLYIDHVLKQKTDANLDMTPEVDAFSSFKSRITIDDLNDQFSIIHEMSRALSKMVPPTELPELLLASLKGLNDPQLTSTSGTCVVLNGLIKARGKELLLKVPQIVGGLLTAMEGISNEQTMNGTLHALRSLATHHEIPVVNRLIEMPVPHTPNVVKAFQAIAKDENLAMPMINHLFQIINNEQLYEEKPDPKTNKNGLVANHIPMSATCSLGEILMLEELEDLVNENFHIFFASLVMRFGTANGMSTTQPAEQAATAFKNFVECSKDQYIQNSLVKDDNLGKLSKNEEYQKGVIAVTAAAAKSKPPEKKKIFDFLFPFLKGNFPGQRTVTATVFAEFVNHCKGEKALLSQIVNCLLLSLGDPIIKIQALRGLGNIVSVEIEEANKYAPSVLDALLTSIDDQNEQVAMEAMNGLAKVFSIVEDARISPIIINICNRIRPAYEKENDEIRAAAFNLFGSLYRFGTGPAADAFYEQLHNNLPAIVLHANDDSALVRTACKGALKSLAPLFKAPDLKDYLLSQFENETRNLDYVEFLNSFSIELIKYFHERINYYVMTSVEYYKSNWNTIKANGAIFTGFLLGNLPIEKRKNLNPTMVARALIGLLKDKSPAVRKAGADAMSLLHTY